MTNLPPLCHLPAPAEFRAAFSASRAAFVALSIELAVERCWTHLETTNYRHRSGPISTWRDDNG